MATIPSMEGRARARPNHHGRDHRRPRRITFNGGPGTCPAKPPAKSSTGSTPPPFNGGPGTCPAKLRRAEHLLELVEVAFNGGPGTCPAKRARIPGPPVRIGRAFNGGPGTCPAKRVCPPPFPERAAIPSMEGRARARPNHRPESRLRVAALQWRAGHVPGQTSPIVEGEPDGVGPSMEGRARARPNRSLDLVPLKCLFAGVCERWRKRELRRYVDCVVKLRFALCHKASSGPLELCAHRSARIR